MESVHDLIFLFLFPFQFLTFCTRVLLCARQYRAISVIKGDKCVYVSFFFSLLILALLCKHNICVAIFFGYNFTISLLLTLIYNLCILVMGCREKLDRILLHNRLLKKKSLSHHCLFRN